MHTDMEAGPQVSGAFRVDVSRGANVSRAASEWYSRPADQRFLSLSDLYASVRGRADRSHTRTVESRAVRVEASRDDMESLALLLPGQDQPTAATHWSFGQLCSLVGAPSGYLRQLPAPLSWRTNCARRWRPRMSAPWPRARWRSTVPISAAT